MYFAPVDTRKGALLRTSRSRLQKTTEILLVGTYFIELSVRQCVLGAFFG